MAAATGSPASRRSTKLIPLTTRPSLTSRQGMTRTFSIAPSLRPRRADQPQRLAGIEPAVIERAAGDGAGQLGGTRVQHLPDVAEGCQPARGDDRDRYGIRQRNGGVEVQALEQPVAGNIGVD